ncbi:hypothetical protein [Gordonia sp. (in: high G+C Gram-positive bacteria)]|uniref:hypothetical protein n=1 Tax=Gordonia sp. (in: high G+C Gram-positive bacteria) TaxID=84139 RepID=UPI003C733348
MVTKPDTDATETGKPTAGSKHRPDIVTWKDADGNTCTGSRHGSAFREHLRSRKD